MDDLFSEAVALKFVAIGGDTVQDQFQHAVTGDFGGGCKLHFAYCLSGGLVVALAGGLGLAILPKGG